jgi:hypothetical protein
MLLPQRLKLCLLSAFMPDRADHLGFPAMYDHCTPRDFRRFSATCGLQVEELRPYYISSYFSVLFPVYVLWRAWIVGYRLISGEHAAESFILVARKPEPSQAERRVENRQEPSTTSTLCRIRQQTMDGRVRRALYDRKTAPSHDKIVRHMVLRALGVIRGVLLRERKPRRFRILDLDQPIMSGNVPAMMGRGRISADVCHNVWMVGGRHPALELERIFE